MSDENVFICCFNRVRDGHSSDCARPSSIPHPEEQQVTSNSSSRGEPRTVNSENHGPRSDLLRERKVWCYCPNCHTGFLNSVWSDGAPARELAVDPSPPTTQDREPKMETPCVNCGYSKFEHDVENGWCFHGGSGEDATQYEPSQGWPVAVPFASPPSSPTSEPIPASDLREAMDELEASAISANNACRTCTHPSCERRRSSLPPARAAIEALFSAQLGEIERLRRDLEFQELRANAHLKTVNRLGAELASLRSSAITPEEAQSLLNEIPGDSRWAMDSAVTKLVDLSALRSSTADKGNTK